MAWRKYQVQLEKLLAGARDAQPLKNQLACAAGRSRQAQSTDSNLDINSSIATNPYGGEDYQSLQDDEIHGMELRLRCHSTGDPGATSASEHLSYPTTTISSGESEDDTTSSGAEQFTDSETRARFRQLHKPQASLSSNSLFPNLPPNIPVYGSSIATDEVERLSTPSASSENSNGVASSSTGARACHNQAEITFLEEVGNLIGDPDDWTSSEDESVTGDPFEVGLMKTGLIDEGVLEDDANPDLLNLEDSLVDLQFGDTSSDTEPTFLYENQKG